MKIKKYLITIIYLVALVFLTYNFFFEIKEIAKNLSEKSGLIITSLLLTLLSFWQQSNNYCILNKLDKKKYFPIFLIWGTSSLVNYFLPLQSGIIVRSLLMKKMRISLLESAKHNGKFIIIGLINAIFLLILMATLQLAGIFLTNQKIILIFISIIGTLYILKSFNLSCNHFLNVLFGSLSQIAVFTFAYYTALNFASNPTSIQQSLILTCSSIISSVISITPNGVGITEFFAIFTNQLLQLNLDNIIPALLFLRICNIIIAIPIALIFIVFHGKIYAKNI